MLDGVERNFHIILLASTLRPWPVDGLQAGSGQLGRKEGIVSQTSLQLVGGGGGKETPAAGPDGPAAPPLRARR